jgi:hypothetical protein
VPGGGALGQVLARLAVGDPWWMTGGLTLINMLECLALPAGCGARLARARQGALARQGFARFDGGDAGRLRAVGHVRATAAAARGRMSPARRLADLVHAHVLGR